MAPFIRKLAVLSVLYAVCDMLLPDGGQKKMAEMTVSLFLMITLISWVSQVTDAAAVHPAQPVFLRQVQEKSKEQYRRVCLQAAADQTRLFCEKTGQKAGYDAQAYVKMTMDGRIEEITLSLQAGADQMVLADQRTVADWMAATLNIPSEHILLAPEKAETQ